MLAEDALSFPPVSLSFRLFAVILLSFLSERFAAWYCFCPCSFVFMPVRIRGGDVRLKRMTMAEIRIRSDRRVDSTDNNGFADGTRDETAIAADLTEEVSVDEEIPEALDEAGVGHRPVYDEAGVRGDD